MVCNGYLARAFEEPPFQVAAPLQPAMSGLFSHTFRPSRRVYDDKTRGDAWASGASASPSLARQSPPQEVAAPMDIAAPLRSLSAHASEFTPGTSVASFTTHPEDPTPSGFEVASCIVSREPQLRRHRSASSPAPHDPEPRTRRSSLSIPELSQQGVCQRRSLADQMTPLVSGSWPPSLTFGSLPPAGEELAFETLARTEAISAATDIGGDGVRPVTVGKRERSMPRWLTRPAVYGRLWATPWQSLKGCIRSRKI